MACRLAGDRATKKFTTLVLLLLLLLLLLFVAGY
jgi:hypothetical protein